MLYILDGFDLSYSQDLLVIYVTNYISFFRYNSDLSNIIFSLDICIYYGHKLFV